MKQLRRTSLVIEAGQGSSLYWQDLWRYRELFYFLAWRDVVVRYKQTLVGIAWVLIRPLITMVAFTIVFGKLAGLESKSPGIPYPILVFAGMLPWQLFSDSLSRVSTSLVSNSHVVSKVYFPRLIVPVSAILVSFVDFLVSNILLLALMAWYSFAPSWRVLTLPFFVLLTCLTALALGLWLAALNVKYRDFSHLTPLILQFGVYISPVGFSSSIVPDRWRLLYSLNPLVGIIDGFRWAVLGRGTQVHWLGFTLSVGLVIVLLATGLWYFRKTERTFADVI